MMRIAAKPSWIRDVRSLLVVLALRERICRAWRIPDDQPEHRDDAAEKQQPQHRTEQAEDEKAEYDLANGDHGVQQDAFDDAGDHCAVLVQAVNGIAGTRMAVVAQRQMLGAFHHGDAQN